MMTTKLRRLRQRNLMIHGLILSLLVITYIILITLYEDEPWFIHATIGVIMTLCIISFAMSIKKMKHFLINKKVKVTHNTMMIPYPQKFVDPLVDVGGFVKGYIHKSKIIPDYLIEFREGRTLYLYQMVHEATEEQFTILKVNNYDVALVLDEQKKKRIIHLGNAELVEEHA